MFKPDFEEFKSHCRNGNLIPVYKELLGDMETPLSIYRKLALNEKNAFLMESVERNEHIGRYSFIGTNPRAIVKIHLDSIEIIENGNSAFHSLTADPFTELKKILKRYNPVQLSDLPRFCGGAVGYFGYGMVHFFENIPQDNPDDLNLPEAYFMITDTLVVFDHVKNTIMVVSNTHINDKDNIELVYKDACDTIDAIIKKLSVQRPDIPAEIAPPLEDKTMNSNMTQHEFEEAVVKAKEYIRAGDIFQVVLSQRFSTETTASPLHIYRALRTINPSPYMFYLSLEGFQIIGSSPEIMVRCEDSVVEIRPIAGTRKRGKSQKENDLLEKDLLSDPKERAEHVMLVDLGRNDIGRVCKFNTVHLAPNEFMIIEHYSHVMHIVTDVKGILKDELDAFDVVKAAFPAGTVSGAPKIRAMEIIDELENRKRGMYAGAVGYFSFHGNLDTAIAIRTLLLKDNTVYIQAGAGIVADSNPTSEYFETINKAKALVKSISFAEYLQQQEDV
ncbi:MAG: anthranilate synthase component I [Candidatus Auribacterota bacterium]